MGGGGRATGCSSARTSRRSAARSSPASGAGFLGCRSRRSTPWPPREGEDARRALRRPVATDRLQHHVRADLRRSVSRVLGSRRPPRRRPRPPQPPRRDADGVLPLADREAPRVQASAWIGASPWASTHGSDFPFDFGLALTPEQAAGVEEIQTVLKDPPDWLEEWGSPSGPIWETGTAGEPQLDRLRARGRRRLPHVHAERARTTTSSCRTGCRSSIARRRVGWTSSGRSGTTSTNEGRYARNGSPQPRKGAPPRRRRARSEAAGAAWVRLGKGTRSRPSRGRRRWPRFLRRALAAPRLPLHVRPGVVGRLPPAPRSPTPSAVFNTPHLGWGLGIWVKAGPDGSGCALV